VRTKEPPETLSGVRESTARGLGTDIVTVARIEELIARRGEAFLTKWFSEAEIAYCNAKARPAQHFAARVAAKEAVVKSLEFEWDGPVVWSSIEIVPGPHTAPRVRLSGRARDIARRRGVTEVSVSLSHCGEFATAVALAQASGWNDSRGSAT
jgi:holo-[acyl-carrier protein] synthase